LNGCPYCYARKLANGRLKPLYLANANISPLDEKGSLCSKAGPDLGGLRALRHSGDPFYPRFWPKRWLDLRWQSPRGIFVCDMGELFGDWIPREWQEKVFDCIKCYPKCRFYLLTKQPQNLPKFSPFPENCFVGITVTSQKMLEPALNYLYQIVAKVKYISFEPLLGPIKVWHSSKTNDNDFTIGGGIDWVIIGAQTKPYKPPEISWVEEIVKACDKAGAKVFQKDNLKPLLGNNLRQELP